MTRIIIPDDFDQRVFYAVESFWKTRSRQKIVRGQAGLPDREIEALLQVESSWIALLNCFAIS